MFALQGTLITAQFPSLKYTNEKCNSSNQKSWAAETDRKNLETVNVWLHDSSQTASSCVGWLAMASTGPGY